MNENINERLAKLEGNPVFKQLEQEEKEKIQAQRKKAAQEIEQVKEESLKVLDKIQADREAAAAELKEAEQVFLAKKEVVAKLDHELYSERHRSSREVDQRKTVLLNTYDPAIDQAIDYFRGKFEEIRHRHIDWQTRKDGVDVLNMRKKFVSYSNKNSLLLALEYCKQAIAKLEDLKLGPDFDPAWIEIVKKGIPDPSQLEEFLSDKGMKDETDYPFSWQFPSDSQHDWEMGKLFEKVDQLLVTPLKQKLEKKRQNLLFDEISRPEKKPDSEKKKQAFQAMKAANKKYATR